MSPRRLGVLLACGALAALFLGDVLAPTAPLYQEIFTRFVLRAVSSAVELATLAAGSLFAVRSALRFGAGNPVRGPWLLLGGWLGAFFVAQLLLSTHQIILRIPSSVPSAADAALLAGYVCMLASTVAFLRVYRRSGFAVGTAPRWAVGALVGVLVTLGVTVLRPIALAPKPLLQRVVNVGFPVLDLTALALIAVLMWTVLPLRGGRVWRVWSTMLVALGLACAGDVLFAYFFFNEWNDLESLVNLVFMASYGAGATAAWQQDRALRRNERRTPAGEPPGGP